MTDRPASRIAYWPFLVANLIFLGLAWMILELGHRPLPLAEIYALVLCVGAGAFCFLMPFRARLKMAESENLITAAEQIKNLELVAVQISSATTLWQGIQEQATNSSTAAQQIGEKMSAEAKAFGEFMQKANDTEKNHLRLEVDKLRRGENEWLQILVHILDHTYALQRAASRSKQRGVAEQILQFQGVCRDTARRVGVLTFEVQTGEKFDPEKHQLLDGDVASEESTVGETIASGYTFQGRLIRPALVKLHVAEVEEDAAMAETPGEAVHNPQTQLL